MVLIARWQSRLGCRKQIVLAFCCVRVFNGESVLSLIPIRIFSNCSKCKPWIFFSIFIHQKKRKQMEGKKTDIKDCQWIQKLHSLGLLQKSFLPDSTTDIIRTYSRHKLNLLNHSASANTNAPLPSRFANNCA